MNTKNTKYFLLVRVIIVIHATNIVQGQDHAIESIDPVQEIEKGEADRGPGIINVFICITKIKFIVKI